MWRQAIVLSAVVVGMLLFPAASQAQFKQQDWELTLGGTGANGPDFNGVAFGVNGSLGYFLTDQIELGVRQSVTYTDIGSTGGGGSSWNGATRIFADYNFDLGKFVPFIGGNLGYVYGDGVHDTWEAAPEAGLKYFMTSTAFVYLMAEYQFFFDSGSNSSSFSDGQFVYTLGIGVRL